MGDDHTGASRSAGSGPVVSFHASATGAETTAWPLSAAVASEAGFAAIDIMLPQLAGETPAAVREVLESHGLAAGPASLPLEFRRDEQTFRRGLTELPAAAAIAAAIGVRTMFRSIPASSDVPRDELLPALRRRLSACTAVLADHGIGFAVEVLGPLHRRRERAHEFIWRLDDGVEFARSLDPPAGMLVDSWHWHHSGGTVADIVALGSEVRHVHIADAAPIPPEAVRDEERLLPGAGVIDHAAFATALGAIGYAGFISPEVPGYTSSLGRVDCARAALDAVVGALKCGPAAWASLR